MIRSTVTITDPAFLWCINDYLHDNWFEADRVHLDGESNRVIMPFFYSSREKYREVGSGRLTQVRALPVYESRLLIAHVEAWEKKDEAYGGWYDFSGVVFDAGARRVTIETNGPPLTIDVQVQAFAITVEISDKVVGEQTVKRIRLLGGAEAERPPRLFEA